MARRVSWTNNSSGHLGTYVYRAPTLDPQALPDPAATVEPVAQGETAEWIDSEELSPGDYEYAVRDFDGSGEGALSAAAAYNVPLVVPNIGDEWQGGYFAGIMLDEADAEYALIVSPKAEGDPGSAMEWQNALDFAAGLSIAGNSDWTLPTLDEMRIIYRAFKRSTQSNNTSSGATDRVDPPLGNYTSSDPAQTTVADFQSGGTEALVANYNWTSTEDSASYVWCVDFYNGNENYYAKSDNRLVRAVRRVPL